MDLRDSALQAVTPTIMVPRFGPFTCLDRPGHRFLAAGNGEWLEVCRAWLYARVRLVPPLRVAKPYGDVIPCVEMSCPPVPLSLLRDFTELAREKCPTEAAAWITWHERSGEFALRGVGVRHASAGHIHFDRPRLSDGEHLVLDLHSHGTASAFFSNVDNEDDRGEVKLSMVVGNCDQPTVSTQIRLCLLGRFIPMDAQLVGDDRLRFSPVEYGEYSNGPFHQT